MKSTQKMGTVTWKLKSTKKPQNMISDDFGTLKGRKNGHVTHFCVHGLPPHMCCRLFKPWYRVNQAVLWATDETVSFCNSKDQESSLKQFFI